jgi:hypothetical protein
MSGRSLDVGLLGATRLVVGLSTILKVSSQPQQLSWTLKQISGGTLEIIPPPIALSGTSASGWGAGYPLGGSEAFNVSGPAVFYLAASAATCIAGFVPAYGLGATIPLVSWPQI